MWVICFFLTACSYITWSIYARKSVKLLKQKISLCWVAKRAHYCFIAKESRQLHGIHNNLYFNSHSINMSLSKEGDSSWSSWNICEMHKKVKQKKAFKTTQCRPGRTAFHRWLACKVLDPWRIDRRHAPIWSSSPQLLCLIRSAVCMLCIYKLDVFSIHANIQ